MSEIPLIPAKEIGSEKKTRRRLEIELIEAEEVFPAAISREPAGAKPIVPIKDGCCIGVCTHLNNEIDSISQAIKIRQDELKIQGRGGTRMRTRRQITALTHKISGLKDLRYIFKEKGVCKCIE